MDFPPWPRYWNKRGERVDRKAGRGRGKHGKGKGKGKGGKGEDNKSGFHRDVQDEVALTSR